MQAYFILRAVNIAKAMPIRAGHMLALDSSFFVKNVTRNNALAVTVQLQF